MEYGRVQRISLLRSGIGGAENVKCCHTWFVTHPYSQGCFIAQNARLQYKVQAYIGPASKLSIIYLYNIDWH